MKHQDHKWVTVREEWLWDILRCQECGLEISENVVNEPLGECKAKNMKLIQIDGDIYVAKDVSAILVNEEEVTVILRGVNEGIDYEFDSEEMAKRQVADAVKVLMSLDNV